MAVVGPVGAGKVNSFLTTFYGCYMNFNCSQAYSNAC